MYQFAGFFAKPAISQPNVLPEGVVWRRIESPFNGIGIRVRDLIDNHLNSVSEVQPLFQQIGLLPTADWIYLDYMCWGGSIDFVHGFGNCDGKEFGLISESNHSKVKAAYITLMGQFGISPEHALAFPPFVRGFWGE